jgi:O-antigen/teichoic acid export membrane protein
VLVISDKMLFMMTSVLAQVLRVLTSFVLLRWVPKGDFGLWTMVGVAPGFFAALGDCGISRALVQFRHLPDDTVEASGLVISAALSLLFTTTWIFSGIYFGRLEHDPRLLYVGLIGGVTMSLSGIYTFQMACLNRDLRFRAEARQNLIFAVALAVTGLSFAFARFGIFALAVQPLAAQVISNAMIYRRHPFKWPRAFKTSVAGEMLNYGWKVTVAQYANNLLQTVVSVFVGLSAGKNGLADYGRANQVCELFGQNSLASFDRILHPLLTSIRDDKERLRSVFIRGCIASTLLCAGGWAWLNGVAPDLIAIVAGPQWKEVPPILQIISFALLSAGAGLMGILIALALGKPLVWLRFACLNILLLTLCYEIVHILNLGHHRPLAAIAVAVIVSQSIVSASLCIWAGRTINASLRKIAGHLIRIILAAGGAHVLIVLVNHGLNGRAPTIVRLVAASFVGGLAYLGLALLLDRKAVLEFRSLVRRRGPEDAKTATCTNCGYDLSGTPGMCPECGTAFQPDISSLAPAEEGAG